jgi:dephospho-CoA kinase
VTERSSRPFVIGVTGNIACGKSTVLQVLARLGALAIDTDLVYHALIAPGEPLNQALVDAFGPAIRSANGEIDRRALGALVFSDPAALANLDRLTHPAVRAAVMERIATCTSAVVAVDAVKLVESGFADFCDEVWVVTCEPEQQRARLMRRNGLSAEEAVRRIAAQPPLAPKLARATAVIDNRGREADTAAQVEQRWRQLPILHV